MWWFILASRAVPAIFAVAGLILHLFGDGLRRHIDCQGLWGEQERDDTGIAIRGKDLAQ